MNFLIVDHWKLLAYYGMMVHLDRAAELNFFLVASDLSLGGGGGFGDCANFGFRVIFQKNFKHQVQGICGQVHRLFLKSFGGHESFLWGHWYPCFGLLVTSTLGFKAKCTDLKNQYWPMVKICPEIIDFLLFCPEKIKYQQKKNLHKFSKNLPKK